MSGAPAAAAVLPPAATSRGRCGATAGQLARGLRCRCRFPRKLWADAAGAFRFVRNGAGVRVVACKPGSERDTTWEVSKGGGSEATISSASVAACTICAAAAMVIGVGQASAAEVTATTAVDQAVASSTRTNNIVARELATWYEPYYKSHLVTHAIANPHRHLPS